MSNKRSSKKEADPTHHVPGDEEPVSGETIAYEPSTQHPSACECDICTGKLKAEKPSKKLIALYIRLNNQLASADKYLEREGLGQNARAKVFKIFEAIANTKLELEKEDEE